jgi:chitinase
MTTLAAVKHKAKEMGYDLKLTTEPEYPYSLVRKESDFVYKYASLDELEADLAAFLAG